VLRATQLSELVKWQKQNVNFLTNASLIFFKFRSGTSQFLWNDGGFLGERKKILGM
jgi:hypothetical protein